MAEYNIYNDIAERSGGDVYIGVVGPVRSGKSTFIKKFMDMLVIPNIENSHSADRARDELPQSAGGRTIMTTEPKFVPNEAVEIRLGDNARLRVRMIDCVGYIVNGAIGQFEDDAPRMVSTPWYDEPIPFCDAAEIGTQKVIREHSNIGLVITTDGSITEIDRSDYVPAEARVINELKEIGKPFIVLVNSTDPDGRNAQSVKAEIQAEHNVPVLAVNCAELEPKDIHNIIESVLFEFPISEITVKVPAWVSVLDNSHWLKKELYDCVAANLGAMERIRDTNDFTKHMSECEHIKKSYIDGIDLGTGIIDIETVFEDSLFYNILGELSGFEIENEERLLTLIKELAGIKAEYDKISYALHEVRENGYGVVSPSTDELTLEEPKIVKQGGKFGVKLRASAPSIHMLRADITTEVSPVVGTEKQSEDLVHYLLEEFENDPKKIWESNLFGKSLYELVTEELHNKLSRMPDDSRMKFRETLERIINEGSGGLICIIL